MTIGASRALVTSNGMAQNSDGANSEIRWSRSTIRYVGTLTSSAGDDDIVFSNARIPENGKSANTRSASRNTSTRNRISVVFRVPSTFGDSRDECINATLTAGDRDCSPPGVSPWILFNRRTIVDGGKAVRIFGDTATAVTKSTRAQVGATLNRDDDEHSESISVAMADGSIECKFTGDEINSFRKQKTNDGGRDGSKYGDVEMASISAGTVGQSDGEVPSAETREDSRATSDDDKPPYGYPPDVDGYLESGIISVVVLTSHLEP